MEELDQNGLAHVLFLVLMLVVITGVSFVGWRTYYSNARETGSADTVTSAWDERIVAGMTAKSCVNLPVVPVPKNYYQGPLVDAHFHPASLPDSDITNKKEHFQKGAKSLLGVNTTIGDAVCMFASDGTTPKNILAFWPVFPDIYKPALEIVKQTTQKYPGMFTNFINPPDDDGSPTGYPTVDAKVLDKMLSVYPGLFSGYGELGLYARKGGAPALAPDSERLLAIYPVLRKHGIKKVFFHPGENHKLALDKVFRDNRDITFIFHGDQMIQQRNNGTQDLSAIEYLLARNPNALYGVDELWGDVYLLNQTGSKEQVSAHFKDYGPLLTKDKATWKPFIEKFPDQVMWDSDRGTYLWTMDPEVGRTIVSYVRAFIAELDPDVQEKYAYKNAERAYADK